LQPYRRFFYEYEPLSNIKIRAVFNLVFSGQLTNEGRHQPPDNDVVDGFVASVNTAVRSENGLLYRQRVKDVADSHVITENDK